MHGRTRFSYNMKEEKRGRGDIISREPTVGRVCFLSSFGGEVFAAVLGQYTL